MVKRKRVKNVFGDDIGALSSFSKREQMIIKLRSKKRQVTIE